jgi:two-component system, response regulator, stage 0 sporulation protein F
VTYPEASGQLSGRAAEPHGPRVLMVEDDDSLRELYGAVLGYAGYDVECIATGEEAVRRCRRQPPPDALIVDIQLGDTDGLSVMRQILEIHPSLPVIIHSAFPSYKGDFTAWCADAYVVKSTDCTKLASCLDRVLEQRRAGVENPR